MALGTAGVPGALDDEAVMRGDGVVVGMLRSARILATRGALSRPCGNSAKAQMVGGVDLSARGHPPTVRIATLLIDAATARQRRGDAAYKSIIGCLLRDRIFDVEVV